MAGVQANQVQTNLPAVEAAERMPSLVNALPDYLLLTLAGFASLLIAYRILDRAPSFEAISGGAATVFIFLALFGVLGVAGQLPHLLQQGKWAR
jgi:hypothetical protein